MFYCAKRVSKRERLKRDYQLEERKTPGNAVGAAFTNRRILQPIEARLLLTAGLLLAGLTALLYFFPRVAAYPLMVALAWIAIALIYRSYKLYRNKASREVTPHQS